MADLDRWLAAIRHGKNETPRTEDSRAATLGEQPIAGRTTEMMTEQNPGPVSRTALVGAQRMNHSEAVPGQPSVGELMQRAQAGDAEAAFQIGLWNARHDALEFTEAADEWFQRARELDGPGMPWRVIDVWFDKSDYARTRHWHTAAIRSEFPTARAPGIVVDSDTLGAIPDFDRGVDFADATVLVETDDHDAAERGLAAAVKRLIWVTEDGHEYTSLEELSDHVNSPEAPRGSDGGPRYNPNYVSEPRRHDEGVWIYLDTRGQMWGPMARTMLHIIVEELAGASVTAARLRSARHIVMAR